MIIDNIKNSNIYHGLNPRIKAALNYLAETDFSQMELGRYDIDGNNIFAMVQEYETKPREEKVFEAHRRYIDVQYVISGIELMGYAHIDTLNIEQDYNETTDALFLSGEGNFLHTSMGTFTILYPQDAHMPGTAIDKPWKVRKVVVKVLVD